VDVMSLFGRLLDQMYPPEKTNDVQLQAAFAKLRKYAK